MDKQKVLINLNESVTFHLWLATQCDFVRPLATSYEIICCLLQNHSLLLAKLSNNSFQIRSLLITEIVLCKKNTRYSLQNSENDFLAKLGELTKFDISFIEH